MVLLGKYLSFLSPLTNLTGKISDKGNTIADEAKIKISCETAGSFTPSAWLYLAEDVGWTSWAPHFTAFHLRPAWYVKDIVLKMKYEMASVSDLSSWIFKPEFYYFDGGIPISGSLECPRNTFCLLTAGWHGSAWHVDRILFSKRGDQLPLRITQLIGNITKTNDAHYILIRGPRLGKVVFNQLSLGLTGQYIAGIHPFTRAPLSKIYPLYLPSKLPDGVISFE